MLMGRKKINLRTERLSLGIKQKEMAEYLSLNVRHYRAIELGESNGSMGVWRKLSEFFDRSIDYLSVEEDCYCARDD
jgi:transcriptional regulator with XRE-family HTH domain